MESLKQQIESLQNELSVIENKDVMTAVDMERRNQINWELTKLEGDLQRQQAEQKHEERVQQNHEHITYLLDTLEVDSIAMRNLCLNEQAYNLLRASVEQAVMGQIKGLSEEIKGYDEREQQLQRQNDHLQDTVKKLETDLQAATETLNKTKFDLEDANNKRDAAVRAKEQAEELLKLKQEELDLERAEKVLGAREAYKVVDQSEQLRKLAEEFNNSRIKVTGIRWEDDLKKTHKLAELVESGETVRFHFFEQGKYLEVTPEEGLQFRIEQAKAQAANLPLVIPAPSLATAPVTEQQFPSSNGNVDQSPEDTTDGEGTSGDEGSSSDHETVSLSARIEALEADVAALKRLNGMVA